MYTEKENLIRTLSGNAPDRFVNGWSAFAFTRDDPLLRLTRGQGRRKGNDWKDAFGVWMTWPEDQIFPTGKHGEQYRVIGDIEDWRKTYRPPDLSGADNYGVWEETRRAADQIDRDKKLLLSFMETGIFERMHFLMGFEDTLCNVLLYPEECMELAKAILEYKMEYVRITIKYMKPDIILSHDDWGEKTRLFMNPEIWRDIFKPLYMELYRYIKSEGIMVMHHADSYCEDIAEDMVDLDIDIWQGVLPQNDIAGIQKQLEGRMTLMGGIDASVVDTMDSSEETIRAEVSRACAAYGPQGYYIPCITYGGPGTLFSHVDSIVKDEIDLCSRRMFAR